MKNLPPYLCLVFLIFLPFSCRHSSDDPYTLPENPNLSFKDKALLKEEFDICPYWHDGLTWPSFLKIRKILKHPGLIKYVDKFQQRDMASKLGVMVATNYLSSHEKIPIASELKKLKLERFVAKATHLSLSGGLILYDHGKDLVDGKPITFEEIERRIYKTLEEKPRDVESWALHQVQPGFFIQEYIADRNEVKLQTVWGKVVIGEWRGGDEGERTAIWGRYDRDGHLLDYRKPAPVWWPEVVRIAERLSEKTDALRVDFLIKESKKGAEILMNEMEIWPESVWTSKAQELADRLNDGYRGQCVIK